MKYEARSIETQEIHDVPSDSAGHVVYFDRRLLVGREGFEPDFSGSITRWVHDPGLTVREMKNKPFDVAPGVVRNTATEQQFLRARDPHASRLDDAMAGGQRVFMIAPRGSNNNRCDRSKPKDAQNCADER
jgi:hypothetical protein